MSIGTRIGRNGLQQIDGASGCQIRAHSNDSGFSPSRLSTSGSTQNGSAFTVSQPGFYFVSGSTTTTGTLPAPGAFPGANVMFREVNNGFSFMLTGSARTAAAALFCRNGAGLGSVSGSTQGGGAISSGFGASLAAGDKLTVPRGGSVNLWSDGALWVIQASSGSLQIEA